jgi:hypothetical protein
MSTLMAKAIAPSIKPSSREQRLAAALRENLSKRKQQARQRQDAVAADEPPGDAEAPHQPADRLPRTLSEPR